MSSNLFKFKFSKTGSAANESGSSENKTLSQETFLRLRDLIYEQSGIYFTETKKYLLEGRIAKRIAARNMKNFEEYTDYLKTGNVRAELSSLFEAITINETYFFRAEQQFDAFEKIIVPEILKNRSKSSAPFFRVWSAASSTGEEAYTLAIIIKERLAPLFPGIKFQIVASDINNQVLENARKGIYKEYSVRNMPANYRSKYFKQSGGAYILSDEIKKMVKFLNINLYDQKQMRTISGCDVVFCCNVLIYFDVRSKQKVVSHLYDALNKGGYLFIGYSESLHGVSKAFKLVHLPKAMAYKKD